MNTGAGTAEYIIGSDGYLDAVAPGKLSAEFKAQMEAKEGNTKFYILKDDGVAVGAVGALDAEFTQNKKRYLVLTDSEAPAVVPLENTHTPGHEDEGVYEFILEVDAENSDEKRSKLFTDIPYGYQFDIWEMTTEGWVLVGIEKDSNKNGRADGQMLTTGKYTYTFTNDREKLPLTIAKEVKGNQGSRDQYFKFKIEIENAGERTLHMDMTHAHRTLEGTASQPPNSATSYTRNVIMNGSDSEGGNNRDDDAGITYADALLMGIEKHCEWTDGTYTYRWNQEDDLWEKYENSTRIDSADEVVVPNDATRTFSHGQHIRTGAQGTENFGKATIYVYLQHGQSVTFRDVPFGSKYTVTEIMENYDPSTAITGPLDDSVTPAENLGDVKTGEARDTDGMSLTEGGDIELGKGKSAVSDTFLRKATEITFTNTKKAAVPTEIRLEMLAWLPVMFLAGGGLVLLRIKKRRELRRAQARVVSCRRHRTGR